MPAQLQARPILLFSRPKRIASRGKAAQFPQPAVSGMVSSPVSAVPAHPQASGRGLGCSELHVPLLGVSRPTAATHGPGSPSHAGGCDEPQAQILLGEIRLFSGNRLPSRGSALAWREANPGPSSASPPP